MTDQALDLDAIQARINGASPLPWTYRDVIDGLHNVTRGGWDIASCGAGDLDPDDGDRDAQAARNAEFVAHSRSDMELMAARIRELEAKNTNLGMARVRASDALDRVSTYAQELAQGAPHVHGIAEEIIARIITNPLPSEQGGQ